jgi:hypothetical protein
MNYFFKKGFSLRQAVLFLVCTFIGIGVTFYAEVTIPNTFAAGRTISSSAVNANFQALADVLPAAKSVTTAGPITISATIPAPPNRGSALQSLPVTLPASGKVMIFASGSVCVTGHTSGNWDGATFMISKTSGDVTGSGVAQFYEIPDTEPSFPAATSVCRPFSSTGIYDETTTGPFIYYLNGIRQSNTSTVEISAVTLTALYIPSTLP